MTVGELDAALKLEGRTLADAGQNYSGRSKPFYQVHFFFPFIPKEDAGIASKLLLFSCR